MPDSIISKDEVTLHRDSSKINAPKPFYQEMLIWTAKVELGIGEA